MPLTYNSLRAPLVARNYHPAQLHLIRHPFNTTQSENKQSILLREVPYTESVSKARGIFTKVFVNGTMSKLTKRAQENKYLIDWKNQMHIYQACVLSTLLYWRQWNLVHLHETGTSLELFPSAMPQAHPWRQVARPRHQQWDTVTCWKPSMYSLLSQRRLRWLGHVQNMDGGRISKEVL